MKGFTVLGICLLVFSVLILPGCDKSASGAAEGMLTDSTATNIAPAMPLVAEGNDSLPAPAPALKADEAAGFDGMFKDFLVAWKSGKPTQLDPWFHPELGMFVEYNPGAYTMALHMETAKDMIEDSYPYEYRRAVTCTPVPGKIPHYSCDEEKWDHEGCFVEKRVHTDLAKMIEQLGEWEMGKGKKEESYPMAQKIDALETVCVFQTDSTVGWNFAFIDGKWYLVRVDFVEPCSA